ncbi:MAG: DNA mismatch repair protein MutS [Bacilli bacterium]|nr:DNA mismatch repair protein MutS [Bacilli bacterium]
MKRSEVDLNKITPMMKQYIEIKEQYEDSILFYRLGDFYEMFFEDATVASHELEIALTGRNAGLEERIPMCGVPHHSANGYIDKLLEKGFKVAICEQTEDPRNAKGLVKRDVTQVVSKGTVMDSHSLDEKDNNYIGNIIYFNHAYGISYMDISTGEFNVLLIEPDDNLLISEILSIGIKEVILASNVNKSVLNILKNQYKIVTSVYDSGNEEFALDIFTDLNDIRYLKTSQHLLNYIIDTQKRSLAHIQKVVIKNQKEYLKMDVHTKRNLELTETLRIKQRNYSLLWLLDKTKTAMGSRMLKRWILNPLIDIDEINKRYDIVETLLNEFILKEDLRNLLYEIYDLERLSGRVAYGNANARDLLQLKNSIKVLPNIKSILNKIHFYNEIETLEDLYELLNNSIYEEPPLSLKEGYLIKEGFNNELDELKEARSGGKEFIAKLEHEERLKTGIKTLKVGFNKVFGYYIEVSKGNKHLVKDEFNYERKQTLANSERYITPLLKEKEQIVLGAEEKIIELEYNLFTEIREQVKTYIPKLQTISKSISEIDVLQSFATVTEGNNYIRPTLTTKKEVYIKDSRHPLVEKVLDNEFVPNDIIMEEGTDILLITGPNMAGKSTYMRQMAIIVIMAQIGCFVPCSEARMPVFDKIFTRIGASDDLVSGESTFMVEMIEANNAISNATENSLILFDELGRGTATYDGMSLAQAIIEYIHHNIKAKTLFSTHYHELTDLEKNLNNLKNIHVSAHEEDGNITFLHKIKEGSVDKSYGIHVARLAKLPESLIKRANEILKLYETNSKEEKENFQLSIPLIVKDEEKEPNIIEEKLKNINPLEITPIDAMNILYELKKYIK